MGDAGRVEGYGAFYSLHIVKIGKRASPQGIWRAPSQKRGEEALLNGRTSRQDEGKEKLCLRFQIGYCLAYLEGTIIKSIRRLIARPCAVALDAKGRLDP